MEIIQQFVITFIEKISKTAFIDGKLNVDDLSGEAIQLSHELAIGVIEEIYNILNQIIREDKAGRKALGLTIKEKDRPRTIITELGEINFKYDYMWDSKEECYAAPLFSLIGIEKNERVSGALKAKLVSNAAFMSYAESARTVIDSMVSRQTVCQAIKETDVEEMADPVSEKKQCEELHIFADEDHIKLQRAKVELESAEAAENTEKKRKGKKKNKQQMVPLVVVTEGVREVGKNRRETIKPKKFVDKEFNTKNLWNNVSGYIAATYDLYSLKKIYVHADGGKWITTGHDILANTIGVMDGFHIAKELTRIHNVFPDLDVRKRVRAAIKSNDLTAVMQLVQEMFDKSTSKKETDRAEKFWTYIRNNWESIHNRQVLDIPGSCTEGQISHTLSDRFSSRPLGWSLKGAGNLSAARVYKMNGGEITRENIKRKHKAGISYSEYANNVFEENLKGHFDFGIFEKSLKMTDMSNPTMKAIARLGNCVGFTL